MLSRVLGLFVFRAERRTKSMFELKEVANRRKGGRHKKGGKKR